jgi:hypothetical protein
LVGDDGETPPSQNHISRGPRAALRKDACAVTLIAADLLRAFPDQVAMVVSAELCSLTLQRNDSSIANVIASCARSGTGEGKAYVERLRKQSGDIAYFNDFEIFVEKMEKEELKRGTHTPGAGMSSLTPTLQARLRPMRFSERRMKSAACSRR